jgi:Fuc2NAc and GlcNAc transferase
MGDVGSGFLGLTFAMFTLQGMYFVGLSVLYAVLIALGVFIVDAGCTLLDRALRRKKFWLAHNEHAYQFAARRWGHKRVTMGVSAINVVWLAPLALLTIVWPNHGWIFVLVAYVPLIALTAALKRPVS